MILEEIYIIWKTFFRHKSLVKGKKNAFFWFLWSLQRFLHKNGRKQAMSVNSTSVLFIVLPSGSSLCKIHSWKESKALFTLKKHALYRCNYICANFLNVGSASVDLRKHGISPTGLQTCWRSRGECNLRKLESLCWLFNIAVTLTRLIFFFCLSDKIPGLQMKTNLLLHSCATATCCGIFSLVLCLRSRGRAEGKEELRELMVASQSSPSVSDANLLVPLETEQSVVIFLLFLLPLQPGKTKREVKEGLWRASLPSSFMLLSFYLTVVLSCSGTATFYSIQGVPGNLKWHKIM